MAGSSVAATSGLGLGCWTDMRLCQVPDCDACPLGSPAPPQLHWEGVGPACSHGGPALCLPGLWVAPAGQVPDPWWCWHLRGTQAPGLAPDGWGGQAGAVLAP